MTLKVTFDVWNLSNSHTSWNSTDLLCGPSAVAEALVTQARSSRKKCKEGNDDEPNPHTKQHHCVLRRRSLTSAVIIPLLASGQIDASQLQKALNHHTSIVKQHFSNTRPFNILTQQEAQLSQRDRATHYVSWNLVKWYTTVRKITFEKACSRWITL